MVAIEVDGIELAARRADAAADALVRIDDRGAAAKAARALALDLLRRELAGDIAEAVFALRLCGRLLALVGVIGAEGEVVLIEGLVVVPVPAYCH